MKRKNKPPNNYPFESSNTRFDFIKICRDMTKSKAWLDLSLRQRQLYFEFKSKFRVNSKTLDTNKDNISIPKSEAMKLYGDLRTFRKDIDALIEHGFIYQKECGFNTRTVNIYAFSEKWKDYGTDKFNITTNEKRYIPKAYRKE